MNMTKYSHNSHSYTYTAATSNHHNYYVRTLIINPPTIQTSTIKTIFQAKDVGATRTHSMLTNAASTRHSFARCKAAVTNPVVTGPSQHTLTWAVAWSSSPRQGCFQPKHSGEAQFWAYSRPATNRLPVQSIARLHANLWFMFWFHNSHSQILWVHALH